MSTSQHITFLGNPHRQPLSSEEIETYKKLFKTNGYIVIKDVFDHDKLIHLQKRICEEFDLAKQDGTLFSGGGIMSGHINCFPGQESRFIYDTLEVLGIIDLIKAFDPNVQRLPNVGCNLNLPNSVVQHYHTDFPFTKAFMLAHVALVDTVIENGAMELVPGTHTSYYPFYRFVLEGVARKSIRLMMNRGDVLIRSSSVWHRGMPNRTKDARPLITLTWEEGGSKQADPYMVNEGKVNFRRNWFRRSLLGKMQERMFVAAPITLSAYLFVTSLYDKKGY
jgi:hypothetical protein